MFQWIGLNRTFCKDIFHLDFNCKIGLQVRRMDKCYVFNRKLGSGTIRVSTPGLSLKVRFECLVRFLPCTDSPSGVLNVNTVRPSWETYWVFSGSRCWPNLIGDSSRLQDWKQSHATAGSHRWGRANWCRPLPEAANMVRPLNHTLPCIKCHHKHSSYFSWKFTAPTGVLLQIQELYRRQLGWLWKIKCWHGHFDIDFV